MVQLGILGIQILLAGGSAAAVASNQSIVSFGADTGGSIRIPAASCGVIGLKPTKGRVPTKNVTDISWTLDHVGPIAANMMNLAIVSEPLLNSSFTEESNKGIKGLKIGIPKNYFHEKVKRIESFPLILSRREEGSGGTYDAIMEEFKRNEIKPKVICESNDIDLIFTLVEAGIGATIMPDYILSHFHKNNIRSLHIVGSSLRNESAIVWFNNRYLSKIAKKFIHTFLNN